MSRIITRKGLMQLIEMKKKGEPLPEGWEIDVEKYIEMKLRALTMNKEIYLNTKNELIEAQDIRGILYGRKAND